MELLTKTIAVSLFHEPGIPPVHMLVVYRDGDYHHTLEDQDWASQEEVDLLQELNRALNSATDDAINAATGGLFMLEGKRAESSYRVAFDPENVQHMIVREQIAWLMVAQIRAGKRSGC